MILRTRCPSCGATYRLQSPPPAEGRRYRCTCGTVITIAYPDVVKQALIQRGIGYAEAGSRAPLMPEAQGPGGSAGSSAGAGASPVTTGEPAPPAQSLPRTAPIPPRPAPAPAPRPAPTPRPAPPAAATAPPPADPGLTPRPYVPPMPPPRPTPPPAFDDESVATLRMRSLEALKPPGRPRIPAFSEEPSPRPLAEPLPEPRSAQAAPSVAPRESSPQAAPPPVAEQPAIPRAVEAPPPPPPRAAPPGAPRAARTDAPARRKKRPADPRPRRPLPAWLRPRWVQWTLALGLGGALLGGGGLVMIILWFGSDLPSVRSLEIYEPPVTTVVTDADGRTLGEFFEEQRYVVPLERVPEHVRNAFVAAEDASFYEHGGLDYLGIVRAMLKNVQEGRMAQGASTITQQVARSFLLSREKKLARKIKEAILASRIERNFDKEHILYLYLNQIFLGHGAYGVQAAARLYFGKDVENLTVAEGAMIAGLPQAPSTYSPNRNWESARQRQRYVLDQMAKRGYITQGQADAAFAEPVRIVRKSDRNLDVAPFYVEHVRRYLKEKYGHDLTYKEGLQIRIPVDAELQVAANHAISEGVRGVDRRMGYRGPLQHWDGKAEIEKERLAIDHERAETLLPYDPSRPIPAGELPGELVPTLEPGERTRGIVESVDAKHAVVRVGSRRGLLSVEDWEWCHKVKPDADFRFFKCKTLDDMLFAGDLVAVEVKDGRDEKWRKLVLDELPSELRGLPRLAMDQDAWPEAALLSMRVKDGAVIAMVGGSDYEGSEFNRAVQAKRQVGSTFKPLVYTAALDAERPAFTPSSVLLDAPIVEQRGDRPDELWKPANSDAEYLGETTFRRGLLLSRNIVTLRILEAIGVKYTVEYMKRFGFDTKLEENLAMGLGASALTLHEMLRAYSVFPTLGDRREPNYILEVRDRHGKVLEARPEGALTEDVIPAETAYIMVNLMLDVVRSGTATRALQLGVPVAGKTGTTNNFRDAWFVGFTRELVTVVWVGLDEFKSMGRGQYGADLALPMWMEYMAPALKKYPPSDYEKPPGVEWVSVDSVSGLLAREGQKGIPVPYKRGSAPTGFAPEAGQMGAADFLSGEY